ncbi:hypothetical protein DFO45_1962 [Azorhizobium sp. AG788]|uniref:hypothetical protein n=1 Tax=Azorhizobium sp. AG788 TaxID=2183897 RepID=UPI0010DFB459|nr:hypothetical protein [Azorhizobium sp. AG788]TDT96764.1 hypothetical protein DFO45_1962 [Azorhizobium sp. AG788]
MRHGSILIIGLVAGALAAASAGHSASAQTTGGVTQTSPSGGAVRTYSNGVRVPVPQNPSAAQEREDGDVTGSVASRERRVPDPNTTRNALGCPQIDPLCQGQ